LGEAIQVRLHVAFAAVCKPYLKSGHPIWQLICAKRRQADKGGQTNREICRIFICAISATGCLKSTCDNRYLQYKAQTPQGG
jgi:hypothetical protein